MPWLFLTPTLIFVGIFSYYAIGKAFVDSFTDATFGIKSNWIGLQNYINAFQDILRSTDADMILMTPNFSSPLDPVDIVKLRERVECIRSAADKFHLCMADVYGFWERFCEKYDPVVSEMLANGINHPTAAGHTVYAECLMQLVRRAAE